MGLKAEFEQWTTEGTAIKQGESTEAYLDGESLNLMAFVHHGSEQKRDRKCLQEGEPEGLRGKSETERVIKRENERYK